MKRSFSSIVSDVPSSSAKSRRVTTSQTVSQSYTVDQYSPLSHTSSTQSPLCVEPCDSSTPSLHVTGDLRRVVDGFVAIYEGLDTSDDPLVKPNYSYTELVYLALLRAPNFCLPISEIYTYIQSMFKFFRQNTREHWRNAVRHSLSKTKCFTKIGVRRGPNSSGTFNRSMFLWTFFPSSIVMFARGDYRPSMEKESGGNTLRLGYYRINAGEFWERIAAAVEKKMTSFKTDLSMSTYKADIFESQTCKLPEGSLPIERPKKSPSLPSSSPLFKTTESRITSVPKSVQSVSPNPLSHSCQPRYNSPPIHKDACINGYDHQYYHHLTRHSTPISGAGGQRQPIYRSTANTSRGHHSASIPIDSDSDFSWNSYTDSGIGSDVSCHDSSYVQSLFNRREFSSTTQNTSLVSSPRKTQMLQSCKYSSTDSVNVAHPAPSISPHDTFNDVQLLPEVPLASLFDLASPYHISSDPYPRIKTEPVYSFVTSSDDLSYLPSFQYSPATSSSGQDNTSSSCMYSSNYGRAYYDYMDSHAVNSIENLLTYAQQHN